MRARAIDWIMVLPKSDFRISGSANLYAKHLRMYAKTSCVRVHWE